MVKIKLHINCFKLALLIVVLLLILTLAISIQTLYKDTQTPYLFEKTDPKQYDLRVIVIVFDRSDSLSRLLKSLNNADYLNDQIKLEVWIDRSKTGVIDEKVLKTSKEFKFEHGEYSVHPRLTHVGIRGQWLYTWKPVENSSEIAVILEDDNEVSPLFYKYLKVVHNKYDSYPYINGFTLQASSIKHSGEKGLPTAPYENTIFIYPVLGAWGFSPSTKNWMKFVDWYKNASNDKEFKPYVPGDIATRWYKNFEASGKQSTVWTIWHHYYAWKNGEFTMYPNIEGHYGFSTNWKEPGLHYSKRHNKPSNPLLTQWKTEYEKLPDKPVKLDINGDIIN